MNTITEAMTAEELEVELEVATNYLEALTKEKARRKRELMRGAKIYSYCSRSEAYDTQKSLHAAGFSVSLVEWSQLSNKYEFCVFAD